MLSYSRAGYRSDDGEGKRIKVWSLMTNLLRAAHDTKILTFWRC